HEARRRDLVLHLPGVLLEAVVLRGDGSDHALRDVSRPLLPLLVGGVEQRIHRASPPRGFGRAPEYRRDDYPPVGGRGEARRARLLRGAPFARSEPHAAIT